MLLGQLAATSAGQIFFEGQTETSMRLYHFSLPFSREGNAKILAKRGKRIINWLSRLIE
jgi:hypothetical protein